MTVARPPEFSCQPTCADHRVVFAVSGELDMCTAPELSRSLAPVLDEHPADLTLDLAGVEFIDSSGLTLLVRTWKRMQQQDGALRLSHPTPSVRRVLELVGLDRLLVA